MAKWPLNTLYFSAEKLRKIYCIFRPETFPAAARNNNFHLARQNQYSLLYYFPFFVHFFLAVRNVHLSNE